MKDLDRSNLNESKSREVVSIPNAAYAEEKALGDLIAKARTGNASAFADILKMLQGRVWRFALKWVRNPDDAEEITQEVFFIAWRNLDQFRGDSAFSTWLLGIALNIARNHIQRGPQRRETELPEDEEVIAHYLPQGRDPASLLEIQQDIERLDKAIRALPMELRETLTLVRLEGLSLADTARLLNIPLGTVKSRLHLARARLLQ